VHERRPYPQDDTMTGAVAHGGDHAVRGRDEALENIARFVDHARSDGITGCR
jgi:hypothetical protein